MLARRCSSSTYSVSHIVERGFDGDDSPCAPAITWGLAILIMTVLGIRRNELPKHLPLSYALFTQSVGYVLTTIVTCVPMGVSVIWIIMSSHIDVVTGDVISTA